MKPVILSSAMWGSVFIRENMSGIKTKNVNGVVTHSGSLCGQPVALLEVEENHCPDIQSNLLATFEPSCLISLGEAFSCKKSLKAGDMIISSAASYLDNLKQGCLNDAAADLKLIDLGLKAAEKFVNDDRTCRVVVGKVFTNPGTLATGRSLDFLPRTGIYCIDSNGYPLAQWVVDSGEPFVLIRTIVPSSLQETKLEDATFKWEMAKQNFWIIKGILEGLKKKQFPETVRKVDLI